MIATFSDWLDQKFPAKCANCREVVRRRRDLCCSDSCFDRYMQGVY